MGEDQKDRARTALEDAVYRCVEAGMTPAQVKEEVDSALESMDE
jgi:hypothetical protein